MQAYSSQKHAVYMRKYYNSTPERLATHRRAVQKYKQDTRPIRLLAIVADREKRALALVRAMSATEAAYLAGLVDSDGGMYSTMKLDKRSGNTYASASLYVTNSQRIMVEWALERTGVGSIYTNRRQQGSRFGTRPMHRWDLGSRAALYVVKQILPYLVVKRRQGELLIELAELKLRSTRGRYIIHADRQKQIVEEMQALNRAAGKTGARELRGGSGC